MHFTPARALTHDISHDKLNYDQKNYSYSGGEIAL